MLQEHLLLLVVLVFLVWLAYDHKNKMILVKSFSTNIKIITTTHFSQYRTTD